MTSDALDTPREPFVQNVNVMGVTPESVRVTAVYGVANAWVGIGPLAIFGTGETTLDQLDSIEALAREVLAQVAAERASLREQAGLAEATS